mmetsp:Transcript_31569/g.65949  ORF Transcript_31569/g.65949 Transcript_31569/m.65949 type:complete len:208 (-) Transcript_31569:45-668(-)
MQGKISCSICATMATSFTLQPHRIPNGMENCCWGQTKSISCQLWWTAIWPKPGPVVALITQQNVLRVLLFFLRRLPVLLRRPPATVRMLVNSEPKMEAHEHVNGSRVVKISFVRCTGIDALSHVVDAPHSLVRLHLPRRHRALLRHPRHPQGNAWIVPTAFEPPMGNCGDASGLPHGVNSGAKSLMKNVPKHAANANVIQKGTVKVE